MDTAPQPSAAVAPPVELLPRVAPIVPTAYADRARAAGGPEDHALYKCDCGHLFEADVTAAVGCPHCGSVQSW